MTKVMKYELVYMSGCGSFSEFQKETWGLQDQTRTILNQTIQMWMNWDYKSREAFENTGKYLDCLAETGYKQYRGYIYDRLKVKNRNMSSGILVATINVGDAKYKAMKKDVLSGNMSVPSYKKGQAINIPKTGVKLDVEDGKEIVILSLFSVAHKKEKGYNKNVVFRIKIGDGTQQAIFHRCLEGQYKIGQCKLVYKKPKWFLALTYSFDASVKELDKAKILGVDVGQVYALYASSVHANGSLAIEGGEVDEYAKRMEAKVRSMQNQSRHCGDGRVGHGTKKRVANIYKQRSSVENFRKTINDRYSRKLVDYAEKNGYGTIQMEDLSGIKHDTGHPRRLRHWTYYDLQSKIEQKAQEAGIVTVKVSPGYTSQRCSRCGCIDKNNRPSQDRFLCVECGFTANADYNASQNLSVKDIDLIIQDSIGASGANIERSLKT